MKEHILSTEQMDKFQFKLTFFSQKEINHLASSPIQDLTSCH